jgi:hypothetical protein
MIRFLAIALLVFSLASVAHAQSQKEDEYVVIPSNIVLLTLASPPGCPVQFENARLLMSVQEKSYAFSYDVRNISSKPIAQWQPMFWSSMGTGGTLSSDKLSQGSSKILLPAEVLHHSSQRLIPLTADLIKQLDLDKYRGGMVALVINSVSFADGTHYEDPSFVTAVRSYFEQLATNLNRLENISRDGPRSPR